ncbi:phage terminase large subunit family protein [Ancylobacter dichloromethanicus]
MTEWADANRTLPGTNAEPGPWRTARVPYLAEIMDCLSTASPVERVVLMKGAQTGGTEAGLNAIGYWVAHAPGLILAVWPSIDMVRRNSRTRIEPLIEGTPALRSRIAPRPLQGPRQYGGAEGVPRRRPHHDRRQLRHRPALHPGALSRARRGGRLPRRC